MCPGRLRRRFDVVVHYRQSYGRGKINASILKYEGFDGLG